MCKSGGGGGDGGAAERENQRQASIQAGYNQIKKIFSGYKTGTNAFTGNVDVNSTYYDAQGNPISVKAQSVANPAYAEYMQKMNNLESNAFAGQFGGSAVLGKQFGPEPSKTRAGFGLYKNGVYTGDYGSEALYTGFSEVPGFDDNFYDGRAQAYQDYAMPQVDRQYEDAVKKLTFALSQNGRLNSSTRANKFADLQEDYDLQKMGVADKGRQYANETRNSVEGARSDLVALNASLADPAQIANEAANRVSALQAAPTFDPLAPLFTNVGEGLATQADLERRQSARYNTGVFTPAPGGSGSARYIR